MTPHDLSSLLTDARYALDQCRRWRDPDRAGDALERIVERLENLCYSSEPPQPADLIDLPPIPDLPDIP